MSCCLLHPVSCPVLVKDAASHHQAAGQRRGKEGSTAPLGPCSKALGQQEDEPAAWVLVLVLPGPKPQMDVMEAAPHTCEVLQRGALDPQAEHLLHRQIHTIIPARCHGGAAAAARARTRL